MADDDNAPLAGGGEVLNTTAPEAQSIEDKLGSFDFDERSEAPAAAAPKEQAEPGDDDAISELAGEESGDKAKASDDEDREVILRDNSKVKISELKRGYRPDWEKQVAEFTERQKAFEQKTQGFTQAEQQYAQLLQQAAQFVEARMPKAPDVSLIETDPFEYQRQEAFYKLELGKLEQLKQTQQVFYQQTQQRHAQEHQERLAKERDATLQALPHLRDPVKAAKFYEDVKVLASELGFTPDEIAGVHSHKVMKLINLALEGKTLKASLEKAKAKLKEAAQQQKPPEVQEPRRRRSSAEVRSEQMRDQLNRLRKTGRASDAETVLSQWD